MVDHSSVLSSVMFGAILPKGWRVVEKTLMHTGPEWEANWTVHMRVNDVSLLLFLVLEATCYLQVCYQIFSTCLAGTVRNVISSCSAPKVSCN